MPACFGDEFPALGEAGAQTTEDGRDLGGYIGGDQHQVAFLGTHRRVETGEFFGREELGDRGTPAVTLAEGPDQALGTQFLCVVDQPIELGPGEFTLAEVDAANGTAGFDDPAEGLEPGSAQDVGQVRDLVSVSQVRLVGAETAHRLVVTHALERNPDLDAHLGEQALDQALVYGEHVLVGHE